MAAKAEPDDSSEGFLAALGEHLIQREGVDVGLGEILKAHILKAVPAPDAVAQAKDAILKLAGARAHPPKTEAVID